MAEESRHLIRAARIAELTELPFRHPLNDKSEVHIRPLSDMAGLTRLGVHLGRIPPGAESFVYHWHHREEEFVFVLEGRGIAEIADQSYEVGPGDFMAFPAPSVGHHLRNPFDRDLVYLMGGERSGFEIGEFPRLGKRAIFEGRESYIVDVSATTPFVPRTS